MPNFTAPAVSSRAEGERKGESVAVLSVTDNDIDHCQLQTILNGSCTMERVCNAVSLRAALRRQPFSVILWDSDSMGAGWQAYAAERGAGCSSGPALIVTSRLADASLWAEALNLGAWDVLAKPYEAQEVRRVLSMALAHTDTITAAAGAGD